MASHTPGPWTWREEEFRPKYMQRMRNGRWRAKPGRRAKESWVLLLTGPTTSPTIPPQHRDEYDYPHILALRWAYIRGTHLYNLGPSPANARLIAAAPNLLEELRYIEAGWAVRERGGPGLAPLNPWEIERLSFVRAAIQAAEETTHVN